MGWAVPLYGCQIRKVLPGVRRRDPGPLHPSRPWGFILLLFYFGKCPVYTKVVQSSVILGGLSLARVVRAENPYIWPLGVSSCRNDKLHAAAVFSRPGASWRVPGAFV